MRVLDELAQALHLAQGQPRPRRVVASVELRHQFGLPITPTRWRELERHLPCALPPLERVAGRWFFPEGWRTVGDLAWYVAGRCPDWGLAVHCTVADWQEAQVFAGVRSCLMEVNPSLTEADIARPARLQHELGLE